MWRKRNFKGFHILSIDYTVSNFKVLIFKHHAIFIEGLCVSFGQQKEPINTKILVKTGSKKIVANYNDTSFYFYKKNFYKKMSLKNLKP